MKTMTVKLEVHYQGNVASHTIKEKVRLGVMKTFGNPYRDDDGILKVVIK